MIIMYTVDVPLLFAPANYVGLWYFCSNFIMWLICLLGVVSVMQVLISRNYKGDIETGVVDKFNSLLLEKEEDSDFATPILQTDGVTFAYIKHNNVYCILLFC